MKTTGFYIKLHRERIGLTQIEVAKALGFKTAQYISNIERDLADLPPMHIRTMSKLLGISAEILYTALEHEASRRIRGQNGRRKTQREL